MPLRLGIYRIRVVLTLNRSTELFPFQSAVVHALISEANGRGGYGTPCIPDGLMLDAPEQCRIHFREGDSFAFGFTLLATGDVEAQSRLQRLRQGLVSVGESAPAGNPSLGGNFSLLAIEDLVARSDLAPGKAPQSIDLRQIQAEIEPLSQCRQATLRFISPLRFHRPKNDRDEGHSYFDETYFSAEILLQRSLARIRGLGIDIERPSSGNGDAPLVKKNNLVWVDIAYGPRSARKSLGGVIGTVTVEGLQTADAAVLVWGHYLRIGESTSFGFGHYEIEELGPPRYRCRRSKSLLDLTTDADRTDQIAQRYSLDSGVLRLACQQVQSGAYQPQLPRLVEIQSKGRSRQLSIPHPLDAALQRCVLDVISPALDRFFCESSLAYRHGLGRHSAARRIRESYQAGYRWAVRSDFHHFFDSIDHSLLRARLAAYLDDVPLVDIIMQWVRSSPVPGIGLPTGAVLSPLLSNLFLDRFDREISRSKGRLIRYADDFLVLFHEFEEADGLFRQTKQVSDELRLQLNVAATDWFPLKENFQFLGFCFHADGDWDSLQMPPPQELSDLGWYERHSQRALAGQQVSLPGETQRYLPVTRKSTLIVGPGLDQFQIEHRRLVVRYSAGKTDSLPLHQVGSVIILGPVDISAATLNRLSDYKVGAMLCSESGHVQSTLSHAGQFGENPELVIEQVGLLQNAGHMLDLARQLINSKILNYAALADAVPGRHHDQETGVQLRQVAASLETCDAIPRLLGYEGTAARIWYGHFNARLPLEFRFEKRIAPRASDPINVLLNIGQTFLYRQLDLMLRQAGFATSLGILHRHRSGHASLASDMQEPFRHLVDRVVIDMARKFRPEDFQAQPHGRFVLTLRPSAARRFMHELQRMLAIECESDGRAGPTSYREHMGRVIRSLRRHLLQGSEWFVFRHPQRQSEPV